MGVPTGVPFLGTPRSETRQHGTLGSITSLTSQSSPPPSSPSHGGSRWFKSNCAHSRTPDSRDAREPGIGVDRLKFVRCAILRASDERESFTPRRYDFISADDRSAESKL